MVVIQFEDVKKLSLFAKLLKHCLYPLWPPFHSHCHKCVPAPIAQLVECPLRGTGGHGFNPGPRHTKVIKNGTSCSSLGTQIYGVELGLVDPLSG